MLNNLLFLLIVFISYSVYAQTDPNNDPNWDWTSSQSFNLYQSNYPTGQSISPTSPFYQGGISQAVYDNKPEDGWVLVMRDFGTPNKTCFRSLFCFV